MVQSMLSDALVDLIAQNQIDFGHPVRALNPKRIWVIYVSRIGDTMLVSPCVRAIARFWPNAEITFVGHPQRVVALESLPYVHKTVGRRGRMMSWLGWFTPKKVDLCFVFGTNASIVRYACRVARHVVAFKQNDDATNRRIHSIVAWPQKYSRHSVNNFLTLVESVGIPNAGRALDYVVRDEETEWARQFLEDRGVPSGATLIGLQIASFRTKAFRDWPIGHFMDLTDRLKEKVPDAWFLIFGGTVERARTRELKRHIGARCLDLAGVLRLRQTSAVMSQTQLYIGVDTGPTHIMGTLGIPMVAMYHGSSPSWFLAPLENDKLFAVDHPRAGQEEIDFRMTDITVDRVLEKALMALSLAPARKYGAK